MKVKRPIEKPLKIACEALAKTLMQTEKIPVGTLRTMFALK